MFNRCASCSIVSPRRDIRRRRRPSCPNRRAAPCRDRIYGRRRIRDQKRRDGRLALRQHLQRKLMIGNRLVEETPPVAVDHHRPRFAAVEHECGNTACDPSRRRRIDAGAQNAGLKSLSLMRAPISIALSCASPFAPDATEDHASSVPSAASAAFGVAAEFRHPPKSARHRCRSRAKRRLTPEPRWSRGPSATRTIFASEAP